MASEEGRVGFLPKDCHDTVEDPIFIYIRASLGEISGFIKSS